MKNWKSWLIPIIYHQRLSLLCGSPAHDYYWSAPSKRACSKQIKIPCILLLWRWKILALKTNAIVSIENRNIGIKTFAFEKVEKVVHWKKFHCKIKQTLKIILFWHFFVFWWQSDFFSSCLIFFQWFFFSVSSFCHGFGGVKEYVESISICCCFFTYKWDFNWHYVGPAEICRNKLFRGVLGEIAEIVC